MDARFAAQESIMKFLDATKGMSATDPVYKKAVTEFAATFVEDTSSAISDNTIVASKIADSLVADLEKYGDKSGSAEEFK